MANGPSDPYRELGLNAEASPEVVRAAYRALARKHHPDNGAEPDAERMVRINRAHEILSDPTRQAAWDAEARRRRDAEAQRQRAQTGPSQGGAQRQRTQAGPRPSDAQQRQAQAGPSRQESGTGSSRTWEEKGRRAARSLGLGPDPQNWLAGLGRWWDNATETAKWVAVAVVFVGAILGARWIQDARSDDGADQAPPQATRPAVPIITAICNTNSDEYLTPQHCAARQATWGIIASDRYRIRIFTLNVPNQREARWSINGGRALRGSEIIAGLQRLSPGVHILRVSVWERGQWTGWSAPFGFNVR